MNCIKEYIVEPIITIEKLYYVCCYSNTVMNNNNHPVTHTFLFSLYTWLPHLISQEPQLWSCRIWQGLLRAECEDRILLPPQVWEFSSSLVEPWVVRMPQSNLMKRSWSLCVSILLIMKILRHIQRHMTQRKRRNIQDNGASPKRERLVSIHTDKTPQTVAIKRLTFHHISA